MLPLMVNVPYLVAAGLFALNVAQYLMQLVWHSKIEKARDAEAQARTAAAWWQSRATKVPEGPPPLPKPQEPFWSRAVTMCRPG